MSVLVQGGSVELAWRAAILNVTPIGGLEGGDPSVAAHEAREEPPEARLPVRPEQQHEAELQVEG